MQASLWPSDGNLLGAQAYAELAAQVRGAFTDKMHALRIEHALAESLKRTYLPLAAWVHAEKPPGHPFIVGVNGAQGSGKSTLTEFLALVLQVGFGYRVAHLSIDDLYLTHEAREQLGRETHPLLVTRGVPGTHDIALGLQVIQALVDGVERSVALPSFDKARDDRRPQAEWPAVTAPVDIVIFEGWCVGARPQSEVELVRPINELEAMEDRDGTWRRLVNQELAGRYAELFKRLDRLIMLKVPNMECVYEWRSLQEEKLAAGTDASARHRIMDSSGLKRFIMHYERLTRQMLDEMPDRADVVLYLNEHHQFTRIHLNNF